MKTQTIYPISAAPNNHGRIWTPCFLSKEGVVRGYFPGRGRCEGIDAPYREAGDVEAWFSQPTGEAAVAGSIVEAIGQECG